MSNHTGLNDNLVAGKLGNFYTKKFLNSKHVRMVSEGDFLSRIRALCAATYLIPFQTIWLLFFLYARIMVGFSLNGNSIVPSDQIWMINEQIFVLNFFITVQILHLILMSSVVIVMLNMTMGRGVSVFTAIFNVLYISEALIYASFIFILRWVGFLEYFTTITGFLYILSSQWLWLFMIFKAMFSFGTLKKLWNEVNTWNREWIRIDRYLRTEDKENAFIFKTWVTPGEIKARRSMIVAGWFAIFAASAFELLNVFVRTDFQVMKYVILIFGYIIYLMAFVIPYSRLSLIFYWLSNAFLFGIVIYALYVAQNQAWQPGKWFLYLYLIMIIPWIWSLRGAIRYTWTLKDKEEIKAVVLNTFNSSDEFEAYLEKREQQQQIEKSEDTI